MTEIHELVKELNDNVRTKEDAIYLIGFLMQKFQIIGLHTDVNGSIWERG